MEDQKIRVAITHGDTNGIGYEVILKAFEDPQMLEFCTPIVYGSPKVAAYHCKAMGLQTNFSIINKAEDARDGRVNMLTVFDEEVKVDFGQSSEEADKAAFCAIERALADREAGLVDVLVAAPHSAAVQKKALHALQKYQETIGETLSDLLPIHICEGLRVAMVTGQLPLKEVAKTISKERITEKAHVLFRSLKRDFRISTPRVALLALNPKEGNNEEWGVEEKEMMIPAIQQLESEDSQAFGPYAADEFFGQSMYDHFDAVLAMYHDQATIPFCTIAHDDSVLLVGGLTFVYTAPNQDCAYAVAGQGQADAMTMRHAIYTAVDVLRNRLNYDEPLKNPLPKLYHEKRDDSEKARFTVRPKDQFKKEPRAPRGESASNSTEETAK